jgi:hypothetical protein
MNEMHQRAARKTERSDCRGDIRVQILDALKRHHEYDLEELVRACSLCTWNQVFLEVDRLSRTGELRLLPKRTGVYAVKLSAELAA